MSAASGSLKVMERLVGFGADVMAIDEDGDTAVHLVLKNNVKEYEMPTDECQEMKKVSSLFEVIIIIMLPLTVACIIMIFKIESTW